MDADMDSPGKFSSMTGVGKLLAEGPFELLTLIQLFLDPIDILALRFTCKHVSGTTRSRIVWVNALRNVSIAQGVFLPSFPVEQMSSDDLEHAALSPHQSRARFQKADKTTPFLTRPFAPHFQGGDLAANSILTVHLVPGGRFLFTSNRQGEVHLWDIGNYAGGHMKSLPVATLAGSEARPSCVEHIRPASNSDSLYVFTSEQNRRISCYEIYPTSEDPRFSRISTLWFNAYNIRITSSKDYLVCHRRADSYFTVWKYAADGLSVSGDISDDEPGYLCETFIFDKNVITFHTTDFRLWTIPDLTPLINGHIKLEPQLRLAYLSIAEQGPRVALPSCWLPELAQNQFGIYYDEISMMALYQIKSIDTAQESDLPNILPIHSGSVQHSQPRNPPIYREIDDVGPLHITEDGFLHILTMASSDVAIGIILKPRPNNPTWSFVRSSIWNESRRDFDFDSVVYDFCPMAGRLVICFLGLNGREVQILDFTPPRSFL
ncbi:uncharacterized protein LACBIDRAFT_295431 [Laccaria bicolor S238N-H82]|uniref:Predicted protein n=1 Tax=Laccaria bicolor (strain S238N-H82 / ATCC MYA-4686) TaxID=486041 RepID=B0DSG3_LACBS|nr:uncharacterized protein LACBIDRAFT_295431 [Laccaria bicolor S238N-H82]EDR02541.1 predicted protein [Laccaria bicolor S238N-H82]|eukprot:XP_001886904.1 predicted protein [Laccaria bicolor S238N-H82]